MRTMWRPGGDVSHEVRPLNVVSALLHQAVALILLANDEMTRPAAAIGLYNTSVSASSMDPPVGPVHC